MSAKNSVQAHDYVHLHNHTQYSLLDGLTKVPALIEQVKSFGMGAVAMTDHGTMSGAIEFYKEAKAAGVKPIIGMEAYVAPRKHTDKDAAKDKNYYHLVLLAMNQTGYKNLMKLATTAQLEGFYYKPRIDHELLEQYNEGLLVLSGCIGGEIGDALRQGQYGNAKKVAEWYQSVFGDRYYFEVQDHGHPDHPAKWDEQVRVNEQIFKLADELTIPCVVTCDAHYLRHEDQEAHEILLCVQTASFLSDKGRMSLKEFELHLTDPKDIFKRWSKDHPAVISNTKLIADRCDLSIELGKILIPKFTVPKGETEKSFLHKQVYSGLVWRYQGMNKVEAARLDEKACIKLLPEHVVERTMYELGVIDSMGFNAYFLIIADFINWAKEQGIVFGPGRGSAAGSIISYSLNITELDPLEYDLLFERFLNPDRISMPDIDIDIQDDRRDEVIRYCVKKYGTERVANIVTFGRMAARNAVRDVARVLQVPYSEADRLAKMIPPPVQGRHIALEKSIKVDVDLAAEYKTNEQTRRIFDLAIRLEGTIRSHGVHAAGVVIAPDDIVKFAPLEMAQKGVVTTQYSMGPIEELGLLKIDFLGLSNLTIIKNALRIIKKVYKKDVNLAAIPFDDSKTFELFQHGDTTGVFQLESAGMKRYLKQLKPTAFDDIIAMVALYRPGPMQWIEDFIARKHGHKKIEYMHPVMEASLGNTYGILVYQEQVMQISKDMCGFTGGQADTLRKAVGKKKPEIMAALKKDFIEGAIKISQIDRLAVENFWSSLEAFAAYCFPKAHAACYAQTAYYTAYLKANYPEAFMAALMTSDFDDIDRLAIEISDCKRMGISVLPPDVNESFVEFAVVPGEHQVRFGMAAIKNVGTGAVEEILRARAIDGNFTNLEDFFSKVNVRMVNRKALESLIKSGAFDRFSGRGVLLASIDMLLAYATRAQKQATSGQTDLFGSDVETLAKPRLALMTSVTAPTPRDQLQWERDLLGIYLSSHPLEPYEIFLDEQTYPLSQLKADHDGKVARAGGTVADLRVIVTKNGQKMAFVKIADRYGEIELILFPNIYLQTINIWERDRVVLAKGRITAKGRDGQLSSEVKILVDEAREILPEEAAAYKATGKKQTMSTKERVASAAVLAVPSLSATKQVIPKRVYVRLASGEDQQVLLSLKQTIDDFQGDTEVVLVLGLKAQKQAIKLPMRMSDTNEALEQLQTLVGSSNVKVQ